MIAYWIYLLTYLEAYVNNKLLQVSNDLDKREKCMVNIYGPNKFVHGCRVPFFFLCILFFALMLISLNDGAMLDSSIHFCHIADPQYIVIKLS